MEQPPKKKYLDAVREILRRRHYAGSTEDSYVGWIKRFIFFHNKRHPPEMGAQAGSMQPEIWKLTEW